jgi:hypothetical protein
MGVEDVEMISTNIKDHHRHLITRIPMATTTMANSSTLVVALGTTKAKTTVQTNTTTDVIVIITIMETIGVVASTVTTITTATAME